MRSGCCIESGVLSEGLRSINTPPFWSGFSVISPDCKEENSRTVVSRAWGQLGKALPGLLLV